MFQYSWDHSGCQRFRSQVRLCFYKFTANWKHCLDDIVVVVVRFVLMIFDVKFNKFDILLRIVNRFDIGEVEEMREMREMREVIEVGDMINDKFLNRKQLLTVLITLSCIDCECQRCGVNVIDSNRTIVFIEL